MNYIRVFTFALCASLAALSAPAVAYVPKVTKADILAAGGRCTANGLCTINGTTWWCSGGGYCVRVDQ